MPRIPDQYLDCAIYLYGSKPDALEGKRSGGSGFLVRMPMPRIPNTHFIYAVTNAHVIEGGSTTIRMNTQDGAFDVRELDERHWLVHPARDDIALCPLSAIDPTVHKFKTVSRADFASKEDVEEFNIGPGDDVFIAGRFVNVEGRQRNVPSMRFGNIAQMPLEPIKQCRVFGEHLQESFLVEGRTISGYSGSPVFIFMLRTIRRPERPELTKDHVKLLGVTWGYIQQWIEVCDQRGRPVDTKLQVPSNTGMMGVVPAWKLSELLDLPQLRRRREDAEEEYIRVHGLPSTALAEQSPDPI